MPDQTARATAASELEARIRDAAFRRSLTFDQAATECGFTGAWLRITLQRRTRPTHQVAEALARFLGCELAEVFALHEKPADPQPAVA